MIEFKLPSMGSDMDEGKLLEWRVAPGQAIKRGDIIAVVDTSKAAVDIECWVDGNVHRLISRVGDLIPVGTVMAELLAPGESAPPSDTAAQATAEPAAAPAPVAAKLLSAATVLAAPQTVPTTTRQRVSPAARRRAIELGVDLAQLQGSGADQAVTLADVERAAAAPGPAAAIDRNIAMRSAIAAAMSRSKREIPHYYLAENVPMRAALDWLREHNAAVPMTERLLPAALLLKAVALALRDAPMLNGHYKNGAFAPSAAIHIGVAIWLRQGGLIAPALHDVADKPLPQLMQELAQLVQRARAGSLRSSELSDATITVTNLGEQGAQTVFGVIYPPQVALVGFGRIREQAWVDDGRIKAMPMLQASLAADHRVSDGHSGALFLARLRERLQQPSTL
jgi:pyruvate dehydrogenase E2 component (dihydrolipoamide acetyltransferase)